MSSATNHEKSPSEAEQDVTDARAELEGSLDELEHRLSPDTMMNDAMTYFRGDGRKYVSTLTREARANPLAVVLIGVGLAWLAVGATRRDERVPVNRRLPGPRTRSATAPRDDLDRRPVTTPAPVTPHMTPPVTPVAPVGTTSAT